MNGSLRQNRLAQIDFRPKGIAVIAANATGIGAAGVHEPQAILEPLRGTGPVPRFQCRQPAGCIGIVIGQFHKSGAVSPLVKDSDKQLHAGMSPGPGTPRGIGKETEPEIALTIA